MTPDLKQEQKDDRELEQIPDAFGEEEQECACPESDGNEEPAADSADGDDRCIVEGVARTPRQVLETSQQNGPRPPDCEVCRTGRG